MWRQMAVFLSHLSIVNDQSFVVSEIYSSNARYYLTESHERRHISWCVESAHTHMCTRPLQSVSEHPWNCINCLVSTRFFIVDCTDKCERCRFVVCFSFSLVFRLLQSTSTIIIKIIIENTHHVLLVTDTALYKK